MIHQDISVWRAAVLAIVVGVLASCGAQSDDAEARSQTSTGESSEGTSGEEDSESELAAVAGFDVDYLERLDDLQLGIDIVIEDSVAACMTEEGFDYQPRTIEQLRQRLNPGTLSGEDSADGSLDQFAAARLALQSLDGSYLTEGSPDPNAEILDGLTEPEQVAWIDTEGQCLEEASEEHPNPLASKTSWFASTSTEASERASNSPEYVTAADDADRCFSDHGYGDADIAYRQMFIDIDAIMSQVSAGTMGESKARRQLEDLIPIEEEMSEAFDECYIPLLATQRRIYAQEFGAIAEKKEDKAAVWAAEFKDDIEEYLRAVEES
jgi:hypothetical protein